MSVSVCLARAQRPHLHLDRNSNLNGSKYLVAYSPDRQLLGDASIALQTKGSLDSDSSDAAGITAQLELVKDQYQLYLGETCVFYITLNNQGGTHVSDITVKVEFVVEGGSSSVLYDSGPSPLPQLPVSGRHDVIVTTDIKEQGAIQLVASAVFTDHFGERKYHVQFFKLSSASPLSVRTRVRSLPHVQLPSSSSSTDQQQVAGSASSRCFLEVSVENTMQLPLVLHAVRLLPAAGIAAQQLTICEQQQQQQHQSQQQRQQSVPPQPDKAAHRATASNGGSSRGGDAQDGGGSDTQLPHDIADAPAVQHKQQQQQQHKGLLNGFDQLHSERQQQAQLGPLLQEQLTAPLKVLHRGGSYNHLWQIDHSPPEKQSSSAAGAAPTGSDGGGSSGRTTSSSSSGGGGSSHLLGRLELQWSNFDGKTGRLLTQPLSGPVTGWHRDVHMQLTQLQAAAETAGAASDHAAAAAAGCSQPVFADYLAVGEPAIATLTLTAAAAAGHAAGPLLVLHTELTPTGPTASGGSSAFGQQQQQQQQDASNGSSNVQHSKQLVSAPNGSSNNGVESSSGSRVHPDIAVQGARTHRVARLMPSQSVCVQFALLPLQRGWVRLPTFVVVSEADGRLLDSVHDVHVLVA